jgi:hypothetical protein
VFCSFGFDARGFISCVFFLSGPFFGELFGAGDIASRLNFRKALFLGLTLSRFFCAKAC